MHVVTVGTGRAEVGEEEQKNQENEAEDEGDQADYDERFVGGRTLFGEEVVGFRRRCGGHGRVGDLLETTVLTFTFFVCKWNPSIPRHSKHSP